MPGSSTCSGYSIPTIALVRITRGITYFVLATLKFMLIKLPYEISKRVQAIPRIKPMFLTPRESANQSPEGLMERHGHYILDLRPEHSEETGEGVGTTGNFTDFIRGGYCIPTIALASVSRLTLYTLPSQCLDSMWVLILTVLGATQLQVRPPHGEESPDTVVNNHYIFDLRPQYGSDIKEMIYNVFENWTDQVPLFKQRKRTKGRRFILKSGWRPELVKPDHKRRTKKNSSDSTRVKPGSVDEKQKKDLLDSSRNDVVDLDDKNSMRKNTLDSNRTELASSGDKKKANKSAFHSIRHTNSLRKHSQQMMSSPFFLSASTVGTDKQSLQLCQQERLDMELPIQDTDQDTDVVAPPLKGKSTVIKCV